MSYIYPKTFPLHQSHELLLQFSSTSNQQDTIQQDMLLVPPPIDCTTDLPIKSDKSRRHKLPAIPDGNNGSCNDTKKRKKSTHRDDEWKRRQEMSNYYASLRLLLPLQYIKGKRSISNHLEGAVNYISNLQKKNQELNDKRDKLRKLSNSSVPEDDVAGGSSHSCPPDCMTVRPCWAGVEVVISSGLKDGVFPLSTVVQVLVDEGFSVVSCVSTKVDERSLHTIQSKISDLTCVDLPRLQRKLTDLIGSPS